MCPNHDINIYHSYEYLPSRFPSPLLPFCSLTFSHMVTLENSSLRRKGQEILLFALGGGRRLPVSLSPFLVLLITSGKDLTWEREKVFKRLECVIDMA